MFVPRVRIVSQVRFLPPVRIHPLQAIVTVRSRVQLDSSLP
jgi:hypothetical protein